MIKWNKRTYARELKKGYWNLEPHFHYYSLIKFMGLFRTCSKAKMSVDDVKSALYGEFVCEGKPIIKGFYDNMNLTAKILDEICKKVVRESKIIERLANLEHKQWIHWTKHMINNLSKANIRRWKRQIKTPYSRLSEKEKSSDRNWAKKAFKIVKKENKNVGK